jgi:hypothetical protein
MKPSEILEKAAAHMERVGHCRHFYFGDDSDWATGACCAVGAVTIAGKFETPRKAEESETAIILARAVVGSTVTWNDAPERTQAEVVAKLREAAELARKEGR